MAIKFSNNSITFTKSGFALTEDSNGFYFEGTISSDRRTTDAFVDEINLYNFQGRASGYTSGGFFTPPPAATNTIDKFPFATDTNASDVGDLTQSRQEVAGQSSSESGYTSGAPGTTLGNTIDKFPFAADTNATDVGDLVETKKAGTGQSSKYNGYGYISSGLTDIPGSPGDYTGTNTIEKFPFASDTNASDVGNLTQARYSSAGQSSFENGYTSGGITDPALSRNTIDRFSFATDTNASNDGDLSQARYNNAGQSSVTHGYTSGGTPTSNTIDKFPFATVANASDVGDLTGIVRNMASQSSTASGYASGGVIPTPAIINTIDKFPFATDTNASDVGDLTVARNSSAGQQI